MTTINERIKEVRVMNNLSQQKFAEILGISRPSVQNFENPNYTRNITPAFIDSICSKFHVNRDWLMTGEGEIESPQQSADDEAIIRAMYGKSEAKKRLIAILASMPDEMFEQFEKAYTERLSKEKSDP